MADEELRLVATLDDQASAGLARLQANVRQLGQGPQAQAMQGVEKLAGGVAEGMQAVGGGFSSAVTSIFAFSSMAALVPVALAGMAASFATSGVNEFANNLNALGREADKLGVDLAQYQANIAAVKTAGLSDSEARQLLQRFTQAQTDLSRPASQTKKSILALYTDPELKRQVTEGLKDAMLAPTEDAMVMIQQMAKDFGESRRGAAEEEAIHREKFGQEAVEFVNREVADAEQEWLRRFNNVNALSAVSAEAFRKVTLEEKAMVKARRDDTGAWEKETLALSEAWTDIKESIAAIVIRPMIPVVQAIATGMKTAASAAQQIEQWFRAPGEGLLNLVERIQGVLPSWARSLQPIRNFLASENPGKALLDMMLQLQASARQFLVNFTPFGAVMRTLLPQGLIDFFLNPSGKIVELLERLTVGVPRLKEPLEPVIKFFEDPAQGIIDIFNWFVAGVVQFKNDVVEIANTIAAWIPQPVKNFFATAGTALYNTVTWIGGAIDKWVGEPLRNFFKAPEQGLYDMINWILDKWEALGEGLESIKGFFSNPGPALLNMVNTLVAKMTDLVPEPVKRLLGIGAPAAQAAPTGAELFGVGHGGGGIRAQPASDLGGQLGLGDIRLQHGGIVTEPTRALIGEAGPEAVIPLQDLQKNMGFVNRLRDLAKNIGFVNQLLEESGSTWTDVAATAAPYAVYGSSLLMENLVPGISDAVDAIATITEDVGAGREFSKRGLNTYDLLKATVPGAGFLETIYRDAQQGHPIRTSLRRMLGIEDPMEPAPWQEGGEWRPVGRGGEFGGGGAQTVFSSLLDRSAAQGVNVSGTGRLMVDVRAPEGTRVNAEAGGLFNSTQIQRSQMLPA